MLKAALFLIILLALPALAIASQRINDPERTLNGKALGTGGTGTVVTSSSKNAKKYMRKSRSQ
jgi:hypothetical protein